MLAAAALLAEDRAISLILGTSLREKRTPFSTASRKSDFSQALWTIFPNVTLPWALSFSSTSYRPLLALSRYTSINTGPISHLVFWSMVRGKSVSWFASSTSCKRATSTGKKRLEDCSERVHLVGTRERIAWRTWKSDKKVLVPMREQEQAANAALSPEPGYDSSVALSQRLRR